MLKEITFDILLKGERNELIRDVQINDTTYQLYIHCLPDKKILRI